MTPPVRVAIVGTSWWADSMFLPAIAHHEHVQLVAAVGRDRGRAEAFADQWGFEGVFTDFDEMLATAKPDAVIVASSNDAHVPLTLAALDAGAHVLCEKPMGRSGAEARTLADRAAETGAITMVPFTYRFMPTAQWLKRLIDDGYLGAPHHLHMRYFTGYALDSDYTWRFDKPLSGSGVLGDLGSHWLHVARWLFGEVTGISATTRSFVERDPRPDGTPGVETEDSAVLTVDFASGAYGVLTVSAVSWQGEGFGQIHHVDAVGREGSLHSVNDWNSVQEVRGLKHGDPGPAAVLPIPDDIWGDMRRDTVHNTYRDVFRTTPAMTRGWIDAIVAGTPVQPDFDEGARVAELLDAALLSVAEGGRRIDV